MLHNQDENFYKKGYLYNYNKKEDVDHPGGGESLQVIDEKESNHTVVTMCIAITVSTKIKIGIILNINRELLNHTESYVKCSRKLKKTNRYPVREEMKQVLDILHSVLIIKKVPDSER